MPRPLFGRCEAEHPINRWPYVKRCEQDAAKSKVYVAPLEKTMDLCNHDFMAYAHSLSEREQSALIRRHAED